MVIFIIKKRQKKHVHAKNESDISSASKYSHLWCLD